MSAKIRLEKTAKKGAYLGKQRRKPAHQEIRGLQGIGKTPDIIKRIDSETGEIQKFIVTKNGEKLYRDSKEVRAHRYFLKCAGIKILHDEKSIRTCLKSPIPCAEIQILKSIEYKKAHYVGLMRCASVWGCPVCASQISERRKAELKAAIGQSKARGWQVSLMTLTVPHGLGDDLKDTKLKLRKSWGRIRDSKKYKGAGGIKEICCIEGTVRASEVTYGENGFHPHFHFLIFSSRNISPEVYKFMFSPLWQTACLKSGLGRPSEKHGVDVRDGAFADEYVSKGNFGLEKSIWGLDSEMTKGQTKLTKSKTGKSMLGLLEDWALNGTESSKWLYRVYFKAYKGERQLHYSKGLKNKLAVEEITDSALIARDDDECSVLATLTLEQWRSVYKTHSQAALLDIAENNEHDIQPFLERISR